MIDVICMHCGEKFLAQRVSRRFCSDYCKSISGFKTKAAAMPLHTCIQCQKQYQPQWPTQVKFCSRSCEVAYSHEHHWSMKDRVCACGNTFKALRRDKTRCDDCTRRARSLRVREARQQKNPSPNYGKGSGYGQRPMDVAPLPADKRRMQEYRTRLNHPRIRCARCGWDECSATLHVHHIDQDWQNNATQNLVVLCPTCHVEVHRVTRRAARTSGEFTRQLARAVFDEWLAEVKLRNEAGTPSSTGQPEPKAAGNSSQGQRIVAGADRVSATTRPGDPNMDQKLC